MHIKLIASDIDGTLIPYHGKVSERTRAAIRACTENRVLFTIATGRWFVTARAAAMDLGQTSGPMVIANGGAVVTMDGEILKEWTFSEVQPKRMPCWRVTASPSMHSRAERSFT